MAPAQPFALYPRIARHAALGDAGPLVRALQALGGGFTEVATTCRYHHLAALVLAAIDESGLRVELDPSLLRALESARPSQPSAATLLQTFQEIEAALGEAGAGVVLLKGMQYAERLYGGYHRRPQFDLDVLVRPRHLRLAARVVRRLGYTRQAYDLHSQTFTRGDEKVDLHGWLRRAPAYRLDEQAIWRDVGAVRLGHLDVPTLSDEFNLVLLGLSCFEDLGQGMAKLKQLLDAFLFLQQVDAWMDWEGFFARRARERTDGVMANVFALVVSLFEAQGLRLGAAVQARRHLLGDTSHGVALALVSAPRKAPGNLSWFAAIYPGNFWHYLAWFWLAGFPDNLTQLPAGRVQAAVTAALGR